MLLINNREWSTWTNLAFLIPAIFAFLNHNIFILILLIFMVIFSTSYHLTKPSGVDWWWHKKKIYQHILQWADTLAGLFIGILILYSILNTKLSIYSIIILIFSAISIVLLFISNKLYEEYHGIWHITASLTILLWILFFK